MSIRALGQTGILVRVLRGRGGSRRYFGIGTDTNYGKSTDDWYTGKIPTIGTFTETALCISDRYKCGEPILVLVTSTLKELYIKTMIQDNRRRGNALSFSNAFPRLHFDVSPFFKLNNMLRKVVGMHTGYQYFYRKPVLLPLSVFR
jgi:hypothetical protein